MPHRAIDDDSQNLRKEISRLEAIAILLVYLPNFKMGRICMRFTNMSFCPVDFSPKIGEGIISWFLFSEESDFVSESSECCK
jgi:hypothetical protein